MQTHIRNTEMITNHFAVLIMQLEHSAPTKKCFPDLVAVAKRRLVSRGAMEFHQLDNVVVTVWQDTSPGEHQRHYRH